jgi:U2 small nuclear ribonucleoprotein B''
MEEPSAIPDAMQDVASTTPGAFQAEPENTSETLYIQNLNENVKVDGDYLPLMLPPEGLNVFSVLKASLRGLFKSYGEVLDVVAHSSLRMRGQAFVSFENAEVAKKAMKEVKGFPLYSKPMVSVPYAVFYVAWS